MGKLDSKATLAAFAALDTETVVVTRRGPGATPGTFTTTTIYSGAADCQSGTGATLMGPSGNQITADAEISFDPIAGVLPSVQSGDLVSWNSQTYTVMQVSSWTYPIKHLSALLKLGALVNKNRK